MNKASGDDGIPVGLFQILKDDAVKVLHSYASKSGKFSSGHRTRKCQFSFQSKEGNAKECSNYCTIALISHANKVMLKILQARLQQSVNRELPDVQAGFRKGRGTKIKLPTSIGSSKSKSSRKNIYFCFIYYAEAFNYVDHNKLENSEKDGNTRPSDLPPKKSVGRSRSNS